MSKLTQRELLVIFGSGAVCHEGVMLKGLIFSIGVATLALQASAQDVPQSAYPACPAGAAEAACMLDAIWTAAEALPLEKRERVEDDFLEVVDYAATDSVSDAWRARLDNRTAKMMPNQSYATKKALSVINTDGWDAFFAKAEAREAPFKFGRPEIMAAGAAHALRNDDTEMADKVLDEMFRLAGREQMVSAYERADFGHMIAEIATKTCDIQRFDSGVEMSVEPESLRYALWRTRISGHAGALAPRIAEGATDEDTRYVRQVIEGYLPVAMQGYCEGPISNLVVTQPDATGRDSHYQHPESPF